MKGSDEAIARLIVAPGENPPPRLVAAFGKARLTLASIIRQERAYPGRKELRLRLEALATAIDFLRREVLNLDMAELLRTADKALLGDKALLYERETYQGLGDLGERVKRLLLDVPKRRGRDKYFWRSEGATPHQNCALMISILWAEVHSKAPPNTNASAQEACAALWAAATGQVKGERKIAGRWRIPSDSTSTEVWRDHLRKAKMRAESKEAKFLKRSLIQGWAETPGPPEEMELICASAGRETKTRKRIFNPPHTFQRM